MRRLRILSAIALCACLPFADVSASHGNRSVQDSVELVDVVHVEGDVVRSSYHSNSALHTVVKNEGKVTSEFDVIEDKSGAKTVRVLATDVRGLSRVHVAYGVLESVRQHQDGARADEGLPELDEVA